MTTDLQGRLQGSLSRCGVLLTLLIGHMSAGLFLANLDEGLVQIQHPAIRHTAATAYHLYATLLLNHQELRLLMLAIVLVAAVRQICGKRMRWFVDLLGGLLLLRCAMQFLILNLLLLAPMRSGALLLMQLVLFLPVITIAFGWLYWRLDSGARRRGRSHIRFDDGNQEIDGFDYFYMAGKTLLSFEPSGATAATRLMKGLFLLHGVVMLDLVALTLSRAIALTNGGG